MEKLVSIIVPVYKVEEYLEDCIKSILTQSYKNLEIILVDDGSPDRCGEICDFWKTKDERIEVIHKTNGGLSDARNAGLDVAQGEYILFVDSDDWIEPRLVEDTMNAMEEHDADICSFGIINCYIDHKERWEIRPFVGDTEKALFALYNDTLMPVASWNKLYRRSLWSGFRFPVGKLYEDAFTTYLIVDKANKIVQIDSPLYCYRIREGSIMNSSFSEKYMDAEEAWRKNYLFVKENYPSLFKDAFDFYLQKVNWIYHSIPRGQREIYKSQYTLLKKILKNNLIYILFRSRLNLKIRIKMIFDFIVW